MQHDPKKHKKQQNTAFSSAIVFSWFPTIPSCNLDDWYFMSSLNSADYGLSPEQLLEKYACENSWGSHPEFARDDWVNEVARTETQRGWQQLTNR